MENVGDPLSFVLADSGEEEESGKFCLKVKTVQTFLF